MQEKCNQGVKLVGLSGDMDRLVQNWTGRHADGLRQAMRMTNESFAEHLGVSVRTVAYWRQRPDMVPKQLFQEVLDTALIRTPQRAKDHFWELAGAGGPSSTPSQLAERLLASEDAASLTDWLTATSVSDEAVAGLDQAVARLTEAHSQAAPAIVLAEARQVQASTQSLLRAGRIRHRQARELLRINGNLLAHISLLLSDLGDSQTGEEYGNASRVYLHEAGASEATAWYVLAKIARWRRQYAVAADLARSGLEHSASGPMRVQLACYEANAAALAGDTSRALSAMRLAEETWAVQPPSQMTPSPWSFPDERMTIFRVSVALGTGDPGLALTAATTWNPALAAPGPHVTAAWAQIRAAAAIARIRTGALDGAAEEVSPVLELPAQFRIATVTGWLDDLRRRLGGYQYLGSPLAASLQEQIRQFTTEAVSERSEGT
jgi:hypothetical protein